MRNKIIAAIALLGTTLSLASCKGTGSNPNSSGTNGDLTAQAESQVAFQMVTASSLLPSLGTVNRAIDPAHQNILDRAQQIELFFLNTADSIKVTAQASDRPEYEHMEVVTYLDDVDETSRMTFYYNSFNHTEHDDWDEMESEAFMNGIVLVGDQELPFIAESEFESEGWDEEESSLEVKIFTGETRRSFVSAKREIEMEDFEREESYVYTAVENGRVVESYELDRENDDGADETEINIVENGQIYAVKFLTRRGVTYIQIASRGPQGRDWATYERVENADGTYTYNQVQTW